MAENTRCHVDSHEGVVDATANDENNLFNSRELRRSLYGGNLTSDCNLEKLSEVLELQVNAIWVEEEPLLLDACRQCTSKHQLVNSPLPIRVLDIGCGTGEVITRLIGQNGLFQQISNCTNELYEIDGVELDPLFYEICKQRFDRLRETTTTSLSVHQGSATKLPFEPNTFDLVLNRHMLHCVPITQIPDVLNEINRVLKPGGIAHFIAEDMEMIYSSTNDDKQFAEHQELWSNGICKTGKETGVDLRIGRKLAAMLPAHGFIVQSIKFGLIDTHRVDRQLLVNIFELWRKLYAEIWKRNNVDYKYDTYFQNFIEVVKDKQQYVCWGLPIIQAVKRATLE